MRCQARQLDSYSSARHCSTARQLLDRPRQTSTELDAQAHGVRLDRLDRNSTVTRQARQARPRQRLDSASTAPRQCLDGASTARQLDSQGSNTGLTRAHAGTRITRTNLTTIHPNPTTQTRTKTATDSTAARTAASPESTAPRGRLRRGRPQRTRPCLHPLPERLPAPARRRSAK